jgi:hypothetical protein
MRTIHFWICLLCLASMLQAQEDSSLSQPAKREFGHFGLALKSGEAAGVMGIQVAWNFTRRLQFCAGAGGMTDVDYLVTGKRGRTDSYYLLSKVYLDHLYLTTGYSLKVSKIERTLGDAIATNTKEEQGIPLSLGYEFGHRQGFYFSTSAGYLLVISEGNRDVGAGSEIGASTARTAKSGPNIGLSIGYYLW